MTSSRVTPASGPAAGSRAGAGAEGREVIRLAPPVVLWWVWMAFVAANAIDYALQGLPSARFGAVVSAILLLVTALMYTLALRPRLVLDASGLTVVNPFRAHHVPWRLITSVDTGEWVRVRYGSGPGGGASDGVASDGVASDGVASDGGDRKIECWALYVSARAKRKIASGGAKPRRGILFGSRETTRWLEGGGSGYAPSSRSSPRPPDEARYLAALPVAKAIALRLDKRAERERARKRAPDGESHLTTSSAWTWPAIAAVVVPVVILIAVAVA